MMAKWYESALKKAKELGGNVASLVKTPDQKFANAIIEALALVTMADGQVDDDEVSEASKYISNVPQITKSFKDGEAMALYQKALVELQNAMAVNRPMMLQRVADNCKENAHKEALMAACVGLAEADGKVPQIEKDMVEKIAKKLSINPEWSKNW